MAKIYISSTFEDLKTERQAAAQALRRLGHIAVAMEDYTAFSQRPLNKCLEDVRTCSAYVGIFALRYGSIPDGYDKSITHLEYEAAREAGIPCLIFLLDENASWLISRVSIGEERTRIDNLRTTLKKRHGGSIFTNADQLNGLVSAAVSGLDLKKQTPPDNSASPGKIAADLTKPGDITGAQLGKYLVLEKLGRGGKGIVFKARDTIYPFTL